MSYELITGSPSEGSFLGTGFGFPLKLTSGGGIEQVTGTDHISACVARLSLFKKGDYPGVYTLGGGVSGLIFGVNAMNRIVGVQKDCTSTIENFEDRVSSLRVQAMQKSDDPQALVIVTEYTIDGLVKRTKDTLLT
jgi:hypothetical protein